MSSEIVILGIILANVIMSMAGFNNNDFFDKYKFQIGRIVNQNQYIRLFSSGFLHADFMHLILNMYVLYSFAPIVYYFLGDLMFLGVYLASLLGGSLLTLYLHRDSPNYTAVGASGAVAGIIFSSILLYPAMEIGILFIPIGIPGYVFGLGYLLFSIYGLNNQLDNIGHSAHLGGAIAGYAVTLTLKPEIIDQSLMIVLLLAIPIVLLIILDRMK